MWNVGLDDSPCVLVVPQSFQVSGSEWLGVQGVGEICWVGAPFTLRLATVQNWMLVQVALEKASLHLHSLQLLKVCPASILQPVHSLKWRGKWSRDINQVLWLVVCHSAQKRMSDDSTQSGCANKEHQTNYLQSGGANNHSGSKFLSFQLCHNLKLQFA